MHEVRDRYFLAKGRFWDFVGLVLGSYGLRASALKPTIMHSYGLSKSGPSALPVGRPAGRPYDYGQHSELRTANRR